MHGAALFFFLFFFFMTVNVGVQKSLMRARDVCRN
jgi:hypothetical protein